jgi:hypothetical protein
MTLLIATSAVTMFQIRLNHTWCAYSSKLVVVAKLVRLGGFHSCTRGGWVAWSSHRMQRLCRWFLGCTRLTVVAVHCHTNLGAKPPNSKL